MREANGDAEDPSRRYLRLTPKKVRKIDLGIAYPVGMAPSLDPADFDHVQMVPLAIGAKLLGGMSPAWCRQLHRRGIIQLERPNPRGRYFIRLDELERISRASVPIICEVHTRRLRK